MNTDSFYYKIYLKKNSKELIAVIDNPNSDIDTKLTALHILNERQELTKDLEAIKEELTHKIQKISSNEIANNRYNTFWRRFFANWIDGIVIGILGFVIKPFENASSPTLINLIYFVSLLIPYLYSILLHGYSGQTIGKMIVGVKIFDKSENSKINFKQAFLRDIIPLSGGLVLFLLSVSGFLTNQGIVTLTAILFMTIMVSWTVLEIITMLFSDKRRALHDFIAGTVVLRIKD